jgi:hypothetical protein
LQVFVAETDPGINSTEMTMKRIISATVMAASLFASGAAFAQAGTSTPGNSGIRDRDAMMKERGMMVRVYDRNGKVYYDGQPSYMRKAKSTVGVYFPSFTAPVEDNFYLAPDHAERSEN